MLHFYIDAPFRTWLPSLNRWGGRKPAFALPELNSLLRDPPTINSGSLTKMWGRSEKHLSFWLPLGFATLAPFLIRPSFPNPAPVPRCYEVGQRDSKGVTRR
jgi:hypothetical protein